MPAAVGAIMMLLSGQNLDGWITLAGKWAPAEGAMVCQAAPASIRSIYESDRFLLRFEYRRAGRGANSLFVHSKMTTGGTGLQLSRAGVGLPGETAEPGAAAGEDEWISVAVEVADGQLKAAARRENGRPFGEAVVRCDPKARGFVRIEATEPGIELRRISAEEPGFRMMFDGKTLKGWEILKPKDPNDPGWIVDKGDVVCRGRRSSWLKTDETYRNVILRLEYQLPPMGNSGIYFRAPIEGRVSRIGLEVQLLDDAGYRGQLKPAQYTGSVYDGIPPEVQVPCPTGQWNAIEVLCDGQHIRTILNSIAVYDTRLDDAKKDTNSQLRPLATRRTEGFLGLQDHSTTVRFRNVRIHELQ